MDPGVYTALANMGFPAVLAVVLLGFLIKEVLSAIKTMIRLQTRTIDLIMHLLDAFEIDAGRKEYGG